MPVLGRIHSMTYSGRLESADIKGKQTTNISHPHGNELAAREGIYLNMRSFFMQWKFISHAVRIKGWRFWLSAVGVAICTLLVLTLMSAMRSATSAIAEYIKSSGADIWVAPPGTDNLVRSSSFLPKTYRNLLLETQGVDRVDPITVGFVTVKRSSANSSDERGMTFIGVGYKSPNGMGGPPRVIAGMVPKGFGEVALDRSGAKRLGVVIGDKVYLGGELARVVGLTEGTNLAISNMLFGDYDYLSIAGGHSEESSFLLVGASKNIKVRALAESIREKLPKAEVIERQDFIFNCSKEASAMFFPILALVSILGVVTATALVALMIHGLTEERRAELATLIALGTSEPQLWFALAWQGFRLVLSGSLAGVFGAIFLGIMLDKFYPILPVSFIAIDVAEILVLFFIAGISASSLPLLRLRNLDPMDAFRP